MRIDDDGNMELSAQENQDLMDRLDIAPGDYEDPPVEIECTRMDNNEAEFSARNTRTGKSVTLVFDLLTEGS